MGQEETRHDVGDAGSEGVEMGDDPKMGQEAEASGASFAGVPKCGHPRRQCHRPGAAAGQRGAALPGSDDRRPNDAVAQGVSKVGRVATGEVDKPGAGHLGGKGRVVGVGAVVDREDDGLDSEPRRLGKTEVVPAC